MADGRLQQLEQVRIPSQEVGLRKVGTHLAAEGQRGVQSRSPEQAKARHQRSRWPDP